MCKKRQNFPNSVFNERNFLYKIDVKKCSIRCLTSKTEKDKKLDKVVVFAFFLKKHIFEKLSVKP